MVDIEPLVNCWNFPKELLHSWIEGLIFSSRNGLKICQKMVTSDVYIVIIWQSVFCSVVVKIIIGIYLSVLSLHLQNSDSIFPQMAYYY